MCREISSLQGFVPAIPSIQTALLHPPHKNPTQSSKIHTTAVISIAGAESLFLVGTHTHSAWQHCSHRLSHAGSCETLSSYVHPPPGPHLYPLSCEGLRAATASDSLLDPFQLLAVSDGEMCSANICSIK